MSRALLQRVPSGRLVLLLTVVWLLCLEALSVAAAEEVPFLTGRVNDYAQMLPEDVESRITTQLEALEESTGAQILVLTVDSLEGEDIEGYSWRVAETWGLGREDVDDGILFVVAQSDRKMRLEVGYGLEPMVTDALSSRILNEIVAPRFRAGDFGGGVEKGVSAVVGLVEGRADALPERVADFPGLRGGAQIGGLLVFLLTVGTFSLSAIFSRGCAAVVLFFFLMPFWYFFPQALLGPPAGLIALVVWVLVFPVLWLWFHKTGAGKRFADKGSWGGPFVSGGGWSSGGGGWSSGGGGFSGGGGSFGGGGASSSW